jgi:hypothetical protein
MCETALALGGCLLHNGRVLTPPRRSLLASLGAALVCATAAFGCSSADDPARDGEPGVSGGQTGSESYGCLPVSERALAPDEATPIGVSASQALAPFAEHERGLLRYTNGETVGYRLVIEPAEPARFEEREWRSDGSGAEIALACDDALVVPVTITLDTDDGAFTERWAAELTVSASGFSSLSVRSELDALAGSYQPDARAIENASAVRVLFNLTLLGSTLGGSLSAQIEETTGMVVSARELPIATFLIP